MSLEHNAVKNCLTVFEGQAFQLQGQLPHTFWHGQVYHVVGRASGLVEADFPVGGDCGPVDQQLAARLSLEHNAVKNCLTVFEGEVGMAGGRDPQIGYLANHEQVGEDGVSLQRFSEIGGYLADGVDGRQVS